MSTKPESVEVKTTCSLLRLVNQRIKSKREHEYHENKRHGKEAQADSTVVPVPDLPEDCISNIIVRLPLESLVTSRFVCKSWYGIVNSHAFIKAHLQRSDIVLIFLTPSIRKDSMFLHRQNLNFSAEVKPVRFDWPLPGPHPLFRVRFMEIKDGKGILKDYNTTCSGKIRAACNGLIVLENHVQGGLILLNPVTRELRNIPPGTITSAKEESYGFGFCHASSKYKLVHLFTDKRGYICCEIMDDDIGSGSTWREVDGPPKGYFYSPLGYLGTPIFAMGALHWLPSVDRIEYMVSMALDDDTFNKTAFLGIVGTKKRIFETGDGFLGCAAVGEVGGVDVWVFRGEGWEKQYSINVNGVRYMVPLYCGRVDGELVFKCNYDGDVYVYDRHSGLMRKIDMMMMTKEWRPPFDFYSFFPHVNSLASSLSLSSIGMGGRTR